MSDAVLPLEALFHCASLSELKRLYDLLLPREDELVRAASRAEHREVCLSVAPVFLLAYLLALLEALLLFALAPNTTL